MNSTAVRDLNVGVPQGSILASWVFCKTYQYTSPLSKIIRSFDLDYHLYSDDTQLYIAFKTTDANKAANYVLN